MFHPGEKVIYPLQGVAQVEAIESKMVLGTEQRYYILRILNNNTTIMVPVDNAEDVGLRELIRRDEVNKVVDILRGRGEPMPSNWTKRYKENLDRLKSGSIFQMASVWRDLILMKRNKELSFGEKRMLDNVKSLVIDELSYVQEVSNTNVESGLLQILADFEMRRDNNNMES